MLYIQIIQTRVAVVRPPRGVKPLLLAGPPFAALGYNPSALRVFRRFSAPRSSGLHPEGQLTHHFVNAWAMAFPNSLAAGGPLAVMMLPSL
ncbi:MAG: hypothetical protein AMJ91_07565 [candidate division Zixibacteria bacterium SM23_73_3]|nr:MAG: hypothetical protein AMJ91_07565 [candidate division Zixibacteria bacterium SM23_73_3]